MVLMTFASGSSRSRFNYFIFLVICFVNSGLAQHVDVEGYVFESDNRGYLNLVEIRIKEKLSGKEYPLIYSAQDGSFKTQLPANQVFSLIALKDLFFEKVQDFKTLNEKTFVKIELQRKPGYIFDVTIANNRKNPNTAVDAISDADIEIYNNTTHKEEVAWLAHREPHFNFTFEKGNHYTLLIRKSGFVSKRVEIFVNVDGCILCVDGLGDLRPGVTDNLTAGHDMGTLLANITLDSININKTFTFKNIYYDYNKWDIMPKASKELMKVAALMSQNPELILELGSHTDSRGKDDYNLELSEKRARSAVEYLVKNGQVDETKLAARGYGETRLVNRCVNGATCTDDEHAENRRTELKIIGIAPLKPEERKSLAQMKKNEQTDQLINSLQDQKIFEVKDTTSGQNFFTGIRVELLISEQELKPTHDVFKAFKTVKHIELDNGKHGYYTGTFNTPIDARDFMDKMKIKLKYPKARLIQFKNGRPQE
jgi:outer membrane protein OmpA-like peptidoglycan-associated protein